MFVPMSVRRHAAPPGVLTLASESELSPYFRGTITGSNLVAIGWKLTLSRELPSALEGPTPGVMSPSEGPGRGGSLW